MTKSIYKNTVRALCLYALIMNINASPTSTSRWQDNEEVVTDRSVIATPVPSSEDWKPLTRYEQGLEDYDEETAHYTENSAETSDPSSNTALALIGDSSQSNPGTEVEEGRILKGDAFGGYYDFIINEGSYKFWAAFQLATAVLLTYSTFAALYYAKANPISADYDDYDYFFKRSLDGRANTESSWFGISSQTFQTIMDAISKKKET